MTVAAMVNTPLDQTGVDSLTRSLQAAAGFDPNRGDVVTVTSLAFNQPVTNNDAALAARQRQELIQRIIAEAANGPSGTAMVFSSARTSAAVWPIFSTRSASALQALAMFKSRALSCGSVAADAKRAQSIA